MGGAGSSNSRGLAGFLGEHEIRESIFELGRNSVDSHRAGVVMANNYIRNGPCPKPNVKFQVREVGGQKA
jgi:hypothetical protein